MKRRRFMQALAAAPAVPALIAQQTEQAPPTGAPGATGVSGGGRGARAGGRGGFGGGVPPAIIDVTQPDAVGETVARFFTTTQFNTLKKLSETLMPPMRGNPGAV